MYKFLKFSERLTLIYLFTSLIVIELFQYENGKYLLEFLRTKGEILDYYNHFLEIRKIIEEKTLKFNI